jgi:phage terminase large subunit GpA-like protein
VARAWDEGRDAPDHALLYALREEYPEGVVPAGAYLLTGMVDVQGDRLHWAVYAWGPGAEWWLVSRDIIRGDPSGEDVWEQLLTVLRKRYPHAEGGELGTTFFGVDSGYKSHHVYKFCSAHRELGARALDGRDGWNMPLIARPKPIKIKIDGRLLGKTLLYPTGTWPAKAELQYSLKKALEVGLNVRAAGRGHWPESCDEDYLREMTAEVLVEDNVKGRVKRIWKVRPGFRNEETDLWVGNRACAFAAGVGLTGDKAFDWAAAREKIIGDQQHDLFDRRNAPPSSERAAAHPAPSPPPAREGNGWKPKHTFAKAG